MFLLIRIGITQIKKISLDFNTSHVSINRYCVFHKGGFVMDFNTSHVSINRRRGYEEPPYYHNFNTSHVSINRGCQERHSGG